MPRGADPGCSGALGHADDEGVALTAATAQRGRADAAAAPLELERQVQHHAGTGHADRVAERDGAAVDVDLVDVDAELLGGGETDGREGLVDLDEVVPVSIPQRKGDPVVFKNDEGIRADTTAASLSGLRPAFSKDGTITAGSASQISDGAAAVVVMSKAKAEELGLSLIHI